MYWNLTGLLYGITSVIIGNIFVIGYNSLKKNQKRIQYSKIEYSKR